MWKNIVGECAYGGVVEIVILIIILLRVVETNIMVVDEVALPTWCQNDVIRRLEHMRTPLWRKLWLRASEGLTWTPHTKRCAKTRRSLLRMTGPLCKPGCFHIRSQIVVAVVLMPSSGTRTGSKYGCDMCSDLPLTHNQLERWVRGQSGPRVCIRSARLGRVRHTLRVRLPDARLRMCAHPSFRSLP